MDDFRNADGPTSLTLGSCAQFILQLLRDTYKTSGVMGGERLKLIELLEVRAWLCHIFITLTRIIFPMLGIAYWQKGLRNAAELEGVNKEFVEENRSLLVTLIMVFIAVGVLMDILIWKWRWLGRYLFYLECCGVVIYSLLPIDLGDLGEIQIVAILAQSFLVFGCDVGYDMIGALATICLNSLVVYPFVYRQTLDSVLITHKLTNIVAVAMMSIVVTLFFTYIARIRAQMEELIAENLGMLTHLSEGLLLVDKQNPKFNLCTAPAFSILSPQLPGQSEHDKDPYIAQLPKVVLI